MATENKVIYGLKNVHYSKMTVNETGKVVYAKPTPIKGAVEISLESKKILAVVSGPNPYAQQFLEEIIEFAREYDGKVQCIIPMEEEVKSIPENLEIIVSANWKEMESYFNQCDVLISRAGYSTLMDLKKLHKIAILVPTKGQLEQVYLRDLHQESAEWKFVSSLKEIDSI